MIASVRGKVAARDAETVVVDVGGVGLELTPTRAAAALARPGEVVTLMAHLHVREDALLLFGFADDEERRLFRLLLGVTSVGPKLALAVVSAISPPALTRAITAGDVALLASVSGVGRKTAQRICLDLRDRVGPVPGGEGPATALEPVPDGAPLDDPFYAAREALVGLGYPVAAAERALAGTEGPPEERIRAGLTRLAGAAR